MPHISKFEYQGERLKSVNEITGALSLEGLIRNFFRKEGFKKADKIANAARDQGTRLATVMEKLRKTGKAGRTSDYNLTCVENWIKWFEATDLVITDDQWVEPHLVNTKDKYHGSPDIILHGPGASEYPQGGRPILGDDKSKKRFCDYKLVMNEHAYAMCDSYEDPVTHEIKKLPWEPPIREFWFWTYHPVTGTLYPVKHEFKEEVYQDFLTCKAMQAVNQRSEKYFTQYAVLLPGEEESCELIRPAAAKA